MAVSMFSEKLSAADFQQFVSMIKEMNERKAEIDKKLKEQIQQGEHIEEKMIVMVIKNVLGIDIDETNASKVQKVMPYGGDGTWFVLRYDGKSLGKIEWELPNIASNFEYRLHFYKGKC